MIVVWVHVSQSSLFRALSEELMQNQHVTLFHFDTRCDVFLCDNPKIASHFMDDFRVPNALVLDTHTPIEGFTLNEYGIKIPSMTLISTFGETSHEGSRHIFTELLTEHDLENHQTCARVAFEFLLSKESLLAPHRL